MLENPIAIKKSTGTRPVVDVIQNLNKINTDNIGLCHTCYSSAVKIISNESNGFSICENCKQKEEK